jgi:hypothetical protein
MGNSAQKVSNMLMPHLALKRILCADNYADSCDLIFSMPSGYEVIPARTSDLKGVVAFKVILLPPNLRLACESDSPPRPA